MSSPTFAIRIVRRHARGDWIVMLPGAGATIAVWWQQVRPFSRKFNLALVDFPGHGQQTRANQNEGMTFSGPYTFDTLVDSLATTLHGAGLTRYHLVTLSLGTILGRALVARHPDRVLSATHAGTIAELTLLPRILMVIGQSARHVLPYMLLYRMYAWVIMPGRRHQRTRVLFYRDARALGRREFNRWFALSASVGPLLQQLRDRVAHVPTLHVVGEHDYMFRKPTETLVATEASELSILPGVGHVCSVEAPDAFTTIVLDFIARHC
jgi:pimeloyl-ACP methyl ester carboxylesterase